MILILNVKNKEKASWLLVENNEVKEVHDFIVEVGEDNLLQSLPVNVKDITGLILYVQEASLTQVKVFTAVINTLAWNFNIPVVGEYFNSQKLEKNLTKLLTKLSKEKKFKPLVVKYKKPAEITISKKQPKYSIIK